MRNKGLLQSLPALWLITAAAVLAPLALLLTYSYNQTIQRVEHGLTVIGHASVKRGDEVLSKTHAVLKNLVAKGYTSCSEQDRKVYGRAVYDHIEIRSIGVIDVKSRSFNCTDTKVFDPPLKMTRPDHWATGEAGQVAISAPSDDVRGRTSIFVNYGHGDGKILDAAIYTEQFWDFQDTLGLGEGGAVLLVDRQGNEITALRNSTQSQVSLATKRESGFSRSGDTFMFAHRSSKYPIEAVAIVSVDSVMKDWRKAALASLPFALAIVGFCCWQMRKLLRGGLSMSERLVQAIDADALNLVYQPIVNTVTGKTESVEVLCRWSNYDLGVVSPEEFVQAAARDGVLPRLTEWVCNRAFVDLDALFARQAGLRMSINVGRADLLADGPLDRAIAGNTSLAQHLTVEITERESLADNFEQIRALLMRWRATGVRIALDDFGTGCCNLAYLRELPVDIVKIDRMFCAGLDDTKNVGDASMFDSMHALLKPLPFELVAEGIEREGQHEAVRSRGVLHAQGWHYARPMSVDALTSWMAPTT